MEAHRLLAHCRVEQIALRVKEGNQELESILATLSQSKVTDLEEDDEVRDPPFAPQVFHRPGYSALFHTMYLISRDADLITVLTPKSSNSGDIPNFSGQGSFRSFQVNANTIMRCREFNVHT